MAFIAQYVVWDSWLQRAEFSLISAGFLALSLTAGSSAQAAKAPPPPPSYALVADQASPASAIAKVKVRGVTALPPERSAGVRQGEVRYYVEAESVSLIRGQEGIAKRLSFLVDGPAEKSARPVIKGGEYLIFGSIGGRVDQFQLLSSKALIPWSETAEALTRNIVKDILTPGAPPAITRIESAFHVAGTVTGESETQIFLQTQDKRPISFSIVRRPGEQPAFSVAIGEVVGEAEGLPAKETLLWYRLACHLPASLPVSAVQELNTNEASAAQQDYAALMSAFTPCRR